MKGSSILKLALHKIDLVTLCYAQTIDQGLDDGEAFI